MRTNRVVGIILSVALWSVGLAAVAQESSSKKDSKPAQKAQSKSEESKATAATTDASYVIGEEDVLIINVWKEPEISRTVPVRPDGKISLPLINDVQAAGLTPSQLGISITEKLRKYMSDPQVTVIVSQINSRRVYIMGEVSRPGAYPLLPNMTVLQALSSAGGFSQFANLKGIYVLRNEDGKQQKFPFNYKDVIKGQRAEQNITLKPGDTIIVP